MTTTTAYRRVDWSNGSLAPYVARGWAFTPLAGKVPIRKGWQSEPAIPLAELQGHGGNIGLRTGAASGIVVIDVDDLEALEPLAERLPVTVEAVTGSDKRHLYYAHDKPLPNSAGKLAPGIDIRADGGQVVFVGSIHPESGQPYRWAEGLSPDEIEIARLPEWVVEALTLKPKPTPAPAPRPSNGNGRDGYVQAALAGECETVRTAGEGTRNSTLNDAAFALGQLVGGGHLDRGTVESELLTAALACGLPEFEARRTIKSGLDKGVETPREIPERDNGRAFGWDDTLGGTEKVVEQSVPQPSGGKPKSDPHFIEHTQPMDLARHVVQHRFIHGGYELRILRHAEEWRRFNGIHWEALPDEEIASAISKHFDGLWTPKRDKNGDPAVDEAGNPINVKVKNNRNTVGETLFAMKALDTLVRHDPPCWLPHGDPALNVMPCRNGLLNVATGEMHPLQARLFCTWGLDFAHDPNAPEPREWLDFLATQWADDPQSVDTLQEVFGLALTADTRYQKIFLLYGPKRSGKGTIARVLTAMLGKGNVASPTLAGLGTNFGLQCLIDKPLAIISDARLSGRTDQAVVVERLLSISGEDAQTIDRKHREPVTLTLPTRFLILTNELPRLSDSSGAMASRFVILKLKQSFYGREDHGLTARLLGELPGILNWSIAGLRRLEERGRFVQPASAAEDVSELETLGSPVAAFVNECCTVAAGQCCEVKALYGKWVEWCKESGRDHPGNIQTFGRDLRAAFTSISIARPRDGESRIRVYEGISYGK